MIAIRFAMIYNELPECLSSYDNDLDNPFVRSYKAKKHGCMVS